MKMMMMMKIYLRIRIYAKRNSLTHVHRAFARDRTRCNEARLLDSYDFSILFTSCIATVCACASRHTSALRKSGQAFSIAPVCACASRHTSALRKSGQAFSTVHSIDIIGYGLRII